MPKNKKLLFALTVAIILLGIIKLSSSLSQPPEVLSSSPNHLARGIDLNAPVQLELSKSARESDITITSSPKEDFSINIENNLVTFGHKLAYYPDTIYTITINYKGASWYTLQFTTQKSQSSPRQVQEISETVKRDYPLAQETPYQTPNFRVVYAGPKILEIELITQIDPDTATQQTKNWVESNGLDADSHEYIIKSITLEKKTIKISN